MFRFYGAAPRLLVPDNLKSGINKASFYDPEVNRSYAATAAHYSVGILPAQPNARGIRPRSKPGYRFAQSYILGRLRNVTFFSLAACNAAIAGAVERMNGREMRRLGVSRRQLFETVERPLMQALPQDDYEYAEWHLARVGIDYHVEVQGFLYSVPHSLLREQVDTRATPRTIEIYHRGKPTAAHVRRYGGQRHGTLPEHMPSAHRRYAEWTPERLQRQAQGIGPNTEALIIAVMARRPHPEQGFRTCLGVLRLFEWHRRRQSRDGQPARRGNWRSDLRLGQLDPQTQARPVGVAAYRGRHGPAARQHPRPPLLPLGDRLCSPIPRSTCCMTSACTACPRAFGIWPITRRVPRSAMRSGSAFCSSAKARCASRSASKAAPRPPSCATRLRSKMSTTVRRRGLDRKMFPEVGRLRLDP